MLNGQEAKRDHGGGSAPVDSGLVSAGTIVKDRWQVGKVIGKGGFGQVHQATDLLSGEVVALKLESNDATRALLKMEVAILRLLAGQPHVPRFHGCGLTTGFGFVAMSLLGDNLGQLRKRCPHQRFSLSTACSLGRDILAGIRILHEHGVLHRDIKPSNLALGCPSSADRHRVFILDFGLARLYRTNAGKVRSPRTFAGFRGTTRYASVAAHENHEQSRGDDLISFLYVLLEFLNGQLPWRRVKDKATVVDLKRKWTPVEMCHGLPPPLVLLTRSILSLGYADRPNYELLDQHLQDAMLTTGASLPVVYEWERVADVDTRTIAPCLEDQSIRVPQVHDLAVGPHDSPPLQTEDAANHDQYVGDGSHVTTHSSSSTPPAAPDKRVSSSSSGKKGSSQRSAPLVSNQPESVMACNSPATLKPACLDPCTDDALLSAPEPSVTLNPPANRSCRGDPSPCASATKTGQTESHSLQAQGLPLTCGHPSVTHALPCVSPELGPVDEPSATRPSTTMLNVTPRLPTVGRRRRILPAPPPEPRPGNHSTRYVDHFMEGGRVSYYMSVSVIQLMTWSASYRLRNVVPLRRFKRGVPGVLDGRTDHDTMRVVDEPFRAGYL